MKKLATVIISLICIFTSTNLCFAQSWNLAGNAGTNAATQFLGTTDNKALKIRTNNTVRITVASTGKVGIGNPSPIWKLDVKGGSINTDSAYRITGLQVLSLTAVNMIQLGDATANVGIGTASPLEKLEVGGTVYSSSGGFKFPDATVQVTAASSATLANLDLSNLSTTAINADMLPKFNNTIDLGSPTKAWKNIYSRNSYFISSVKVVDISGVNNVFLGNTTNTTNTGNDITAVGTIALSSNTTGIANVATGSSALRFNTTGSSNTACGYQALVNNTTGYYNTSSGSNSLFSNTTGFNNVANGLYALFGNNTGHSNTAIGLQALYYNTSGTYNSAVGRDAGNSSGTTPTNFTALGYNAGKVGSGSNSVEIGNTSVGWIGGMTNWFTFFSDRRIKENIQSNVPGLSFITKLNPVTYNVNIHKQSEICGIKDTNEWEGKYDIEKIVQTGFLAQEVEQAAKECNYNFDGVVAPNGNRKLYSMSYASFVMPLVKAVQELDAKNEKLQNENQVLKNKIEEMNACLETLCNNSLETKSQNSQLATLNYLEQNNPNPFKENTTIGFYISLSSSKALLKIFSINGEEIKSSIISTKGKGQIEIAGNTLAPGVYTYVLIVDDKTIDTKQMVVTK